MEEVKECNESCKWAPKGNHCIKPPNVTCPLHKKVIRILGEEWTIWEKSEQEDERLKDCDGYCDWTTREIVVEREVCGNLGDMEAYIRKVTRHEIVHAFLLESGLHECAGKVESWAANEEMVDWIARQGPKIFETWKEAGALDV